MPKFDWIKVLFLLVYVFLVTLFFLSFFRLLPNSLIYYLLFPFFAILSIVSFTFYQFKFVQNNSYIRFNNQESFEYNCKSPNLLVKNNETPNVKSIFYWKDIKEIVFIEDLNSPRSRIYRGIFLDIKIIKKDKVVVSVPVYSNHERQVFDNIYAFYKKNLENQFNIKFYHEKYFLGDFASKIEI